MNKIYETAYKCKILLLTVNNSNVISRLLYIFGFIFLIPDREKGGKTFLGILCRITLTRKRKGNSSN